jgi:hypothetical protein
MILGIINESVEVRMAYFGVASIVSVLVAFVGFILFQFSVKEVIFYHQNSRGVGPLVTNKEIITYIYTSIAALLYIPAVQGCVQFIDTLTDFSANLWQATRSLAKK